MGRERWREGLEGEREGQRQRGIETSEQETHSRVADGRGGELSKG